MIDKILNRKTLLIGGTIAALFYAALGILMYLMDITAMRTISYVLVGLTAAAVIVWFGRSGGRIRFEWKQILLIALLVWSVISCIAMTLRQNADYVSYNMEPIVDTAITLLVVFPLGYVAAREEKIPVVLKALLHAVLLGWSLFMAVVLVVIFRGDVIYTANNGMIGMRNYQFLYINCYYNTTGMWQAVFAPLCFYLALKCKPVPLKAGYGLATVINYAILALSNSRASTYAVMIGMSLMGGIAVYSWLQNRKMLHRILFAVAAAGVTALILYLLRKGTFELYWSAARKAAPSQDVTVTGKIRDLSDSTVSTFTGRTKIWECTFRGMFNSAHNAIFGVTPAGVIPMITEISDGKWDVYTHNQFLEIGAANGVVGMGFFTAFIVLVVKDVYTLFFVRKENGIFLCLPILILILMIANFLEATLLYYGFISAYAFFFLCGFLHGRVNDPVTQRQANRRERRRKMRNMT